MVVMKEKYLNILETLIEVHLALTTVGDEEFIEISDKFFTMLQERHNVEKENFVKKIEAKDLIKIQKLFEKSRKSFKGRMIV